MKINNISYAEHILNIFTGILHDTITVKPLADIDYDLTPSLAHALQLLSRHEMCYVRDIAQGLSMTYSAASQLTNRLVKKELATRCDNTKDRRLSEIRLTELGKSLINEINAKRLKGMTEILDRMDHKKRESLIEDLEFFIAAAVKDGEPALSKCDNCKLAHLPDCMIKEVYRSVQGRGLNSSQRN